MLDDDDGVAEFDESVQHVEEPVDVGEVEAGGRFVEEVERAAGGFFAELGGELDALRLPPGERGAGLSQRDVSEADIHQRPKQALERWDVGEHLQRLLHAKVKNLRDVQPLEPDVERLPVVASPLALLANHEHVREEVHLDDLGALALACLAAPALDVERKPSRPVAAYLGLLDHGEDAADVVEDLGVRRRVRARGPADRRLVNLADLVDALRPDDPLVLAGPLAAAVELTRECAVEDLRDERALAGAAHARYGDEHPEREGDAQRLQVVLPRAADLDDVLPGHRAPRVGYGNLQPAGEIGARERVHLAQDLLDAALGHNLAAVRAGAGAEVDEVVRGADGGLVVLHDDDRVAEVAQMA